MPPGWNGKQLLRRRLSTSIRSRSSPGKLTITRSWKRLIHKGCRLQDSVNAGTAVHEHHGEAHAAHNPALLHHFATPDQQRNSASLGMWVFLATEIMFFGAWSSAYLIYRRWYFPHSPQPANPWTPALAPPTPPCS